MTTEQQIINDVARHFGITTRQLIHGDKHRVFSEPRHIAAYCLRVKLGMEYSAIGRLLGGKVHGTIIYAVNKVGGYMRLGQLTDEESMLINRLVG